MNSENSSGSSTASPRASSTEATSTSGTSTEAPSHAGLAPLGEASLEPHTHNPADMGMLVVTSVRAASHDGFDRIVFETTGSGAPGWIADYTDSPRQQASGDPIEVPGDTALEIMITGTAYPFELGVDNPNIGRVEMNTELVSDIVDGGTFEAQSQFIIGIKGERRPYSVQVLENPTRVVIDILHK